jgi:hypothetical protein
MPADRARHEHISPNEARTLLENNVTPAANSYLCLVGTTTQSLLTGVRTLVTFTTEVYDTDSMWAIGDATKIYAARAGLYLIVMRVLYTYHSGTGNVREHLIYKNGIRVDYEKRKGTDKYHHYTWSRIIQMEKDDYLQVYLMQGTGSTLSNNTCYLGIARMAL